MATVIIRNVSDADVVMARANTGEATASKAFHRCVIDCDRMRGDISSARARIAELESALAVKTQALQDVATACQRVIVLASQQDLLTDA